MNNYEIARRLKGHRATHPMAPMSQLENLVEYILKYQGEDMNPSVGRIVHYFAPRYSVDAPAHLGGQPTGSRVLPAIITYVHNEELVDLVIFGSFENGEEKTSVRINDQALPGTWFWPPRV